MYAYLEGVPGGSDLDKLIKNCKKIINSHRRISKLNLFNLFPFQFFCSFSVF